MAHFYGHAHIDAGMLTLLAVAQTLLLANTEFGARNIRVVGCMDTLAFEYGTVSFAKVKKMIIVVLFASVLFAAYLDVAWCATMKGMVRTPSVIVWFSLAMLLILMPLVISAALLFVQGATMANTAAYSRDLPAAAVLLLANHNLTYVPTWPDDASALRVPIQTACVCKLCERTCEAVRGLLAPLCFLDIAPTRTLSALYATTVTQTWSGIAFTCAALMYVPVMLAMCLCMRRKLMGHGGP